MKILLTGAFNYSREQFKKISSFGYEIIYIQDERISLQVNVKDIDVVVCNSLFLYNDIALFKSLKFIQLTSSGLNGVPMDYIREKGIKLVRARGIYSIPIAEWVVLKILEIYKKSRHFYVNQNQRKWKKIKDIFELTGKTATIIGIGSVGNEIVKRLKAFGVNIIGVDIKSMENDLVDEYYDLDDLGQVLKISDIVILSVPLNEKTHHLIDAKNISRMKDGSVLINVSRGKIIDEVALIQALKNHKFLGVALDVFEEEPLSETNLLWDFENVLITPHNSFISDKVNGRLFRLIFDNIKDFNRI